MSTSTNPNQSLPITYANNIPTNTTINSDSHANTANMPTVAPIPITPTTPTLTPILPLSVLLETGGRLTFGTCSHCVVSETTRPAQAWDSDPERSELDFDQAGIFAALAALGIEVQIEEEYGCP